jgi:hypothetical protein
MITLPIKLTDKHLHSPSLHSIKPNGNECNHFSETLNKGIFMKTETVKQAAMQKQKLALAIKSNVKAGPPMIIKRPD